MTVKILILHTHPEEEKKEKIDLVAKDRNLNLEEETDLIHPEAVNNHLLLNPHLIVTVVIDHLLRKEVKAVIIEANLEKDQFQKVEKRVEEKANQKVLTDLCPLVKKDIKKEKDHPVKENNSHLVTIVVAKINIAKIKKIIKLLNIIVVILSQKKKKK